LTVSAVARQASAILVAPLPMNWSTGPATPDRDTDAMNRLDLTKDRAVPP
jgi:hypothetical protein